MQLECRLVTFRDGWNQRSSLEARLDRSFLVQHHRRALSTSKHFVKSYTAFPDCILYQGHRSKASGYAVNTAFRLTVYVCFFINSTNYPLYQHKHFFLPDCYANDATGFFGTWATLPTFRLTRTFFCSFSNAVFWAARLDQGRPISTQNAISTPHSTFLLTTFANVIIIAF